MNNSQHNISVASNSRNIAIHIDTSCGGVYVQFSDGKVVKTIDCSRNDEIVTVDLDAKGEAVGVEAIGLKSLSINQIFDTIKPHIPSISRESLDAAEISMPPIAV